VFEPPPLPPETLNQFIYMKKILLVYIELLHPSTPLPPSALEPMPPDEPARPERVKIVAGL
jgi:hypothetical protein